MIGFRQLIEKINDVSDYDKMNLNHFSKTMPLAHKLRDHYDYNKNKKEDEFRSPEFRSIDHYAGSGYIHINMHLWDKHQGRKNNLNDDDRTMAESHIKNLDSAMNMHKTPHALSVYSSIQHHFDPEVDKTYHHPAYLSTSLNRKSASFFSKSNFVSTSTNGNGDGAFHRHMLHINVPKDHPGIFAESVSPGEQEFILPRGTNLKHKHTHTYLKKGKGPWEKDAYYHVHHMDIVK